MGWRPDLQVEIQNAETPHAGRHGCWEYQVAHFKVLPDESGVQQYRAVPSLGQSSPSCPVLVVPVPLANERPPLQGVPGVEGPAENPVWGCAERDREVEGPLDYLRPRD